MDKPLIRNINYEREWKKTLLYKFSFGKAKPSNNWKIQLKRLYEKKYNTKFD